MYPSTNYNKYVDLRIGTVERLVDNINTDTVNVHTSVAGGTTIVQETLSARLEDTPFFQQVRAVATTPLDLAEVRAPTVPLVVDGVTLVAGDHILLTEQTDPKENGYITVGPGPIVPDEPWWRERTVVAVLEGTQHRGNLYLMVVLNGAHDTQQVGGMATSTGQAVVSTLASEATTTVGAVSLVGPRSVAPALRTRFLLAGQGIQLTDVDTGRGLRVSGSRVTVTHSAVRCADILTTDGQMAVVQGFALATAAAWPLSNGLGSMAVPALRYDASGTTTSHRGSCQFVAPDLPNVNSAFDLELTVACPATLTGSPPTGPLSFQVALMFPAANLSILQYRGTATLPAGSLVDKRPVRVAVVWDPADAAKYRETGPEDTTGNLRPVLPADAPGADLLHLELSMASQALSVPVGILGMRFVWYPL